MSPLPVHTPHHSSLRASVFDGMWFSVMLGASESYLGAFGIFLGGTPLQIALLATVPPLIGSLTQLLGVRLLTRGANRLALIVAGARIQACVWLVLALLPMLRDSSLSVWALILGATAYHCFGNAIAPAWNSLIGDLVPAESRGTYFGYRNWYIGMVTLASLVGAGIGLHLARDLGIEPVGFQILCAAGCLSRLQSARWLARHENPPHPPATEGHFTFWDFIRRLPRANFARFVVFVAALNAAVSVAGPFFALYMLRELGLSYVVFTAVSAMQLLLQFLTMQWWGRFADTYGNRSLLSLCAWGVSLTPLLWLLGSHPLWLIAIQAYAGTVWAGYSLASFGFLFDAVTPQKRARCAAYMGVINGVFVCLGALLGSALMHLDAPIAGSGGLYLSIFLLSFALRALVCTFLLPTFREVRTVTPFAIREIGIRIAAIRPIAGASFGFTTDDSKRKK